MTEILKLRLDPKSYVVESIHGCLESPYISIPNEKAGLEIRRASSKIADKKICRFKFVLMNNNFNVYICYNREEDGGRGRAEREANTNIIPLYLPNRRALLCIPRQTLVSGLSKWCSLLFSPEDNCFPERDGDYLTWSVNL